MPSVDLKDVPSPPQSKRYSSKALFPIFLSLVRPSWISAIDDSLANPFPPDKLGSPIERYHDLRRRFRGRGQRSGANEARGTPGYILVRCNLVKWS
jgi:hypothetical protein